MCLKPKYIHFVYSFVAYVAFSSYLHREDQFVIVVTFLLLLLLFFFFTRSTVICHCSW